MAVMTLPLQLGVEVAGSHPVAQTTASAELGRLAALFQINLFLGNGFVIAMVQTYRCIVGMRHIHILPVGNGAPSGYAAEISQQKNPEIIFPALSIVSPR